MKWEKEILINTYLKRLSIIYKTTHVVEVIGSQVLVNSLRKSAN